MIYLWSGVPIASTQFMPSIFVSPPLKPLGSCSRASFEKAPAAWLVRRTSFISQPACSRSVWMVLMTRFSIESPVGLQMLTTAGLLSLMFLRARSEVVMLPR